MGASDDKSRLLGQRLAELDAVITALHAAEKVEADAVQDADDAEYAALLASEATSEDRRKADARLRTADMRRAARHAAADARNLARRVKLAHARVDVGRTYSADLRAEASVSGRDLP